MSTQITSSLFLPFVLVLLLSISWVVASSPNHTHEHFIHCLRNNSSSISKVIYTPNNSLYASILDLAVQSLRFTKPTTTKPMLIVIVALNYPLTGQECNARRTHKLKGLSD